MFRSFIVLIAALCSLVLSSHSSIAQDVTADTTSVVIEVTDSHGDTLPFAWRITSFRDEYGENWVDKFDANGTGSVPPGDYTMGVDADNFLPFEGHVFVIGPTTFKVGLLFAGIESSPPSETVLGRFERAPGEDSWCKLSGLYTADVRFAKVEQNGVFRFPNVPAATYVLSCLREDTPLETRIVDVHLSRTPEIVFSSR